MAAIKKRGDEIQVICGKVQCKRCICCGPTSGQNVFEITEEEYDNYFNGGEWNISTQWSQNQTANPNCISNGSGGGNAQGEGKGCFHAVSGIGESRATNSGFCAIFAEDFNFFDFGITLELGIECFEEQPKYFARYTAYSNVSDSKIASSPTGYPTNVNFNVDGNDLIAFGIWFPSWMVLDGYTNNSTITLTATFSPNS